MTLPFDYTERVYAGVLGKMIGVYLGRPVEGWTYEKITAELGEISYYVNDRLPENPPLVITDDDLSGTFTFLRALPDHGNHLDLTAAQIGDTWLNYLVENRTILWWGGLGNSTEHTAYLRLKQGIPAPHSGSMALNGKTIAEQIGAQIFIDGWAMVAPGDPQLAADLARRAASVSHDGEAVYGAQVMAAMESLAFVETDIDRLLDAAQSLIPGDSVINRLISDIRDWHAGEPDWRRTRKRIAGRYGYQHYPGVCHMVPNHALIILGLLYGEGSFHESMKVVTTAGWDTDCNAGNLGCLLGIRNGLPGFEDGPDWRGPLADRLFLVSADGGECITDALRVAYQVVNIGRALAGEKPLLSKGDARFHFEQPGSIQGFRAMPDDAHPGVSIKNVHGYSNKGSYVLALHYPPGGGSVTTPTFILPDELHMPGYELMASPSLYAGQTVRVGVSAERDARMRLMARKYQPGDTLEDFYAPWVSLGAGEYMETRWTIPDTNGQPIAEIGVEIEDDAETDGVIYLDYLTWDGEPDITLASPAPGSRHEKCTAWRRAWVDGVDHWQTYQAEPFDLIQNTGRGLIIHGTRQWQDVQVRSAIRSTLMKAGGVALRVQGMRRYYALLLQADGKLRLVKMLDNEQVLAESPFEWELDTDYSLTFSAKGVHLKAWVDEVLLFDLKDKENPLLNGAIGLVCEEGHLTSRIVEVKPAQGVS
jgi:ADP-ribosylglycohydrolase